MIVFVRVIIIVCFGVESWIDLMHLSMLFFAVGSQFDWIGSAWLWIFARFSGR